MNEVNVYKLMPGGQDIFGLLYQYLHLMNQCYGHTTRHFAYSSLNINHTKLILHSKS